MKNKIFIVGVVLVLIFVAIVAIRFFLSGDEDTWICQNGRWVKHGSPREPMPETGCGEQDRESNKGEEKYEVYKADDFEVKYPYWQNIDKKNLLDPEKTKLAVTDGKCNFVVTAIPVPTNTNFKDYTQKLVQEQITKTKSKVIAQDIKDNTAYMEGELNIGNTTLYSISYGYMTSKRQSYGIAFISEKSLFESACQPIINEVVESVKVK